MERKGWTPERAKRGLQLSFEAGDVVGQTEREPGVYIITSKSQPGKLYEIGSDNRGTILNCTCDGMRFRGWCRHAARVAWIVQNKQRAAEGRPLIPAPDGWSHDATPIEQVEMAVAS